VDLFESLFSVAPAVTIAFLAGLAQREVGKDGEGEFYRHLEAELDHRL
jgi:hypothetical protein